MIVILLTPAVGGMARLLGVVDRPETPAAERQPGPAARRPRDLLRDLRAGARVPELGRETRGVLLGAAVATVVGAIDDFRGLAGGGSSAGQVVAASIPPCFGVWIDHFTFPFFGIVDLPGRGSACR